MPSDCGNHVIKLEAFHFHRKLRDVEKSFSPRGELDVRPGDGNASEEMHFFEGVHLEDVVVGSGKHPKVVNRQSDCRKCFAMYLKSFTKIKLIHRLSCIQKYTKNTKKDRKTDTKTNHSQPDLF
jgi:hypothetical protein